MRGGDSGDYADLDPGGAAGVDLFRCPAEDQGVSALEANDILAGQGKFDHQGVDFGLLARRAVAGLADG